MSKDIIKGRDQEKKKATELLALRQKLAANPTPKAKDCRQLAEAMGAPAVEDAADSGLAQIMALVKAQAEAGKTFAQVPAGPTNHPEVRASVIKKLEAAGFKVELAVTTGYIYW